MRSATVPSVVASSNRDLVGVPLVDKILQASPPKKDLEDDTPKTFKKGLRSLSRVLSG